MNTWEQRFVETFVAKHKRERYLSFLAGSKNRRKVLHDLNTHFEMAPCLVSEVPHSAQTKVELLKLFQASGASDQAHVMALDSDLDGCDLPLEEALDIVFESPWGVLLISPPQPVVLYKTEDPGTTQILQPRSPRGPGAR